MKKRGHYCKVCGEYKANEKFSGKGHAAHITYSTLYLSMGKALGGWFPKHLSARDYVYAGHSNSAWNLGTKWSDMGTGGCRHLNHSCNGCICGSYSQRATKIH